MSALRHQSQNRCEGREYGTRVILPKSYCHAPENRPMPYFLPHIARQALLWCDSPSGRQQRGRAMCQVARPLDARVALLIPIA